MRRARWILAAMSTVKASTRRLGSETDTRSPASVPVTMPSTTSAMPL
ncbi:MAG: hypothetical protein R2699_17250 [Acidimicrobiales bacterium]